MSNLPPVIKHREIVLRGPCDKALRADSALMLLTDAEGVLQATRLDDYQISVCYNLRLITLEQLETALAEVGFHLDASLMSQLKRAIYYYTEDNERINLGLQKALCPRGCAVKVFVKHYTSRDHGSRDPRPEHFKHYF